MRKRIACFVVMLSVVLACSVSAGPGKVKLPPYKETTLKNGLTVFVMETHEVPLVTVRLLVAAGSAHDAPGREGTANLAARLLLKGAAGLGAEELSETIEGAGGRLEAYTGRDYTLVTGDFMSRDLDLALDLLGTVTMKPDFIADEIERERGLVTAEIQSDKEQPSALATRVFRCALMEGHPYGHPVEGTQESVAAVTRDDIVAFHRTYYVPGGNILAVVGDVDSRDALKKVTDAFGAWKGDGGPRPAAGLEVKRFPGRRVIVIDKPDATQSQIRIGNRAVGRNTPDFFPLLVSNNVLGGGFTSRLMDEIRVNRGLSYGARSSLSQMKSGGVFGVYTFTKNQTLRETIDVALAQLGRIRTEKVAEAELESSKKYLSGLFPFEIETNDDLARWLTELAFYGIGNDFVENYRDEVARVTADDVMRVANEHFHTDDCLILLLTNYEETRQQVEDLGDIEVIGIGDVH